MGSGTVGIAPGTTTLRLPDGTVIAVADWSDRDQWGSVDFVPRVGDFYSTPRDAFSYARSQTVSGSGRIATWTDSSLPRPGHMGLPQAFEFLVFAWRAAVVAPREVIESDAAQVFFETTAVRFDYNQKTRAVSTLADLLRVTPLKPPEEEIPGAPSMAPPAGIGRAPGPRQPQPPPGAPGRTHDQLDKAYMGRTFVLPIRVQENLGFAGIVEPQHRPACDALAVTLAHLGVDMTVRVYLSGLWKESVY